VGEYQYVLPPMSDTTRGGARIQPDSGLEITDRVAVTVASNEQTDKAIAEYADYIKTQVQADALNIGVNDGEAIDFDDFSLNIKVEKI
jgi:isoleucyl-tRNA synthetase